MFTFGELPHVLPLAVHLDFLETASHSKSLLLFEFLDLSPPSCLNVKSCRVGGGASGLSRISGDSSKEDSGMGLFIY